MTAAQLISTIIFFAMPGGVGAVYYLCRFYAQRFAEYQAVRLEQFARLAAQQVEQQNGDLGGTAKKQLAIASVSKLFDAFRLPMPPPSAVGIAIESAVFLLPHKPKEQL